MSDTVIDPLSVSDTIWHREIAKGFQDLFPKVIGKYPVIVRKPDEDFKVESYPVVSLQFLYEQFNTLRNFNKDYVYVKQDREKYEGTFEKPPLTYDLNIQVDFMTKLQSDLDSMTIKWLAFQQRDFNLSVTTNGGLFDTVHVMPSGNPKRMDEVFREERIMRCCYNYKVYGRINEHTGRVLIPLLRTVTVNTKNKIG